jgi:predicted SnoaL-like aldol condensation-catalyzing enzyme
MLTTTAATNKQTGKKRITIKSADLYRIENNGTIAEHWDVMDRSGME